MTSTTIELDDEARTLVVDCLVKCVRDDLDELAGARALGTPMLPAQRRFLARRASNRLTVARAISGHEEGWVPLEERIASAYTRIMEDERRDLAGPGE